MFITVFRTGDMVFVRDFTGDCVGDILEARIGEIAELRKKEFRAGIASLLTALLIVLFRTDVILLRTGDIADPRTGDFALERFSNSWKKLAPLIKLDGLEFIKDFVGLADEEAGPVDDFKTRAGLDLKPIRVFGPFDGVLTDALGLCVNDDDKPSVSNLSGEAFNPINDRRFPRRSGLICGPGGVIGRKGS